MTEAFAASFTGPLFVTALAAPLLGERIGWRRWAAVGVGFAGVVVMLKPDAAGVELAILLPVASALLGAFRDIATRRLTQGENTVAILAYATAAQVLVALASFPLGWQPLSLFAFALFFAAGLIMGFSQLFMIQAFRYAEAATVVPFKYATLVWATASGFLVFGDVPDRAIVLGALLIAGSGLYVFHREAGRRRRAKVE
jgi:drug/metabolite transporter (DMT)-like permease